MIIPHTYLKIFIIVDIGIEKIKIKNTHTKKVISKTEKSKISHEITLSQRGGKRSHLMKKINSTKKEKLLS